MPTLADRTFVGQPLGTLSYDGYVFDGSSQVKAKTIPLKDDAGRVTIAHEITLTITGVIANQGGNRMFWTELETKLLRQGGRFVMTGRGFLDIDTSGYNSLNRSRDIANGPSPQSLDWEPIGSSNSCAFVYVVKITLPVPCYLDQLGIPSVLNSGVMAFNYSLDYSYNDGGYCTRAIAGYIQIAQNTGTDSRPLDAIDQYRERLRVPVLPNFTRNQSFQITPDRTRMNFTITDTEIESPNAYPEGVRKIEARHRVSWQRGKGQGMLPRNFVGASIELLPTVAPERAFRIFLDLLFSRIQTSEQNGVPVFLDSLDVEEDIYSRSSSFSASYRILGGIPEFLDMGLWKRLPDTWDRWAVGARFAKDVRGHTLLNFTRGEDIVISLCNQRDGALFEDYLKPEPRYREKPRKPENKKPPPDKSYVGFQNQIVPKSQTPSYRQRPLQPPKSQSDDPYAPGYVSGGTVAGSADMRATSLDLGTTSGTADTLQQSGQPSMDVALIGLATRAGYPIPKPKLEKFGNQTPIETDSVFDCRIVAVCFGVPLYAARWAINYMIPGLPGTVTIPDNVEQNQ
ncbi:MAG: hypothetical protein SFX18_13310 [Pirellulales bacterium]|nr:hypothetical protein [Pirellulales bacterium]